LKLTRLREVRELRGWSQSKLAEEADVSRDGISNYETSHREAWPSTAKKLADTLGVEIADLVTRVEEPILTGKAQAPREAGQLAEEPEEERHIAPIHPSVLEGHIKLIKRLKEQREAEIGEVKQGAMPRVLWDFHLEADNKYLEIIHETAGISAFVEEVISGRRMEDWPVQQLCHEFSRHLSDFLKLADEAKVLDHQKQSDPHVEAVKGTSALERYLRDEAQKQRSPEG
jgi:transcriptional regulator with XRE-family HTH domain